MTLVRLIPLAQLWTTAATSTSDEINPDMEPVTDRLALLTLGEAHDMRRLLRAVTKEDGPESAEQVDEHGRSPLGSLRRWTTGRSSAAVHRVVLHCSTGSLRAPATAPATDSHRVLLASELCGSW